MVGGIAAAVKLQIVADTGEATQSEINSASVHETNKDECDQQVADCP